MAGQSTAFDLSLLSKYCSLLNKANLCCYLEPAIAAFVKTSKKWWKIINCYHIQHRPEQATFFITNHCVKIELKTFPTSLLTALKFYSGLTIISAKLHRWEGIFMLNAYCALEILWCIFRWIFFGRTKIAFPAGCRESFSFIFLHYQKEW